MKMMPLKSKILTFILTIVATTASFGQDNQQVIDKIVAQIGDQIILYSSIENTKQQAIYQGQTGASIKDCAILEEMLYQKLLVNQAELDSIVVPEEQVEAEIDRRIQYFASQMPGGIEALEEFYDMSVEEIKEEFYIEIEAKMMAQEMERTITSGISISPKEVKDFFNELPKDSIPYINSQVTFAQIIIKPEIKQADKDRTRNELKKIKKSIEEGRSFSSMAALYSEDPGTRKNGGEFDYVSRGTFVPEFDATAFSLKPGEISDVFETSYGFHILELIDRRGEQYKGRHILLIPEVSDQALESAAMEADSILQLVKDDKYTFGEAAEKFSDDETTKNNGGKKFHPQSGSTKWDMSELDRGTFQVINRLEVGDISGVELITDEEGQRAFRIIKLLARTKPHVANLKDDYQYISAAALNYKKQKVLDEWIAKNINTAYINIKKEYRDCEYNYDWMKVK